MFADLPSLPRRTGLENFVGSADWEGVRCPIRDSSGYRVDRFARKAVDSAET